MYYTSDYKYNFFFQVKEMVNRSPEGFTCELLNVINKINKSFLDKYIKKPILPSNNGCCKRCKLGILNMLNILILYMPIWIFSS